MDDNDAEAAQAQLRKARRAWARISRVLRRENAPPRVCGMFYVAVVQAVLLYGSETWTLGAATLRLLEGFQLRAAYRMARENRPLRGQDGKWTYPQTADVLAEVGLRPVAEYIRRRRDTIAAWVVDRPLFRECREGTRQRGTTHHHLWWWELPMTLDEPVVPAGEVDGVLGVG